MTQQQQKEEIQVQLQAQDGWQQLQREREELQHKVGELQGCVKNLHGEKMEAERKLARLGKERSALRKALEKVMTLLHSFNMICFYVFSVNYPFIYSLPIKMLTACD